MFKKLFKLRRTTSLPHTPKPGVFLDRPEFGASLEEVEAWVARVQKRNEESEQRIARVGEDAQAERKAELLYIKTKQGIAGLGTKAERYFWLKLLWYMAWRAPFSLQEEVDREQKRGHLPDGYQIAHTPRPYWIRRPRGGDEFDRGEVAERLGVPI